MQYFYSSLLALFVLIASEGISAQNAPESQKSYQYPDEFVRGYAQECMQTSMAEGLAEVEAKQLCNCTLDKFQSQYSLDEFKELTANSVSDKKAEATLIEVGQVCFEQMLYEQ